MTKQCIDQMGHHLNIPSSPQRIISLVPSQTELLFDLGLADQVVGATKFCIHPKERVRETRKIGGTKNFKLSVIDELQPDLIIGNKEENYQEGIEQLQEKYPVWMSDIADLDDALAMIRGIGSITGKADQASAIAERIQSDFDALSSASIIRRTLYFIWQDPHMVAGKGTFIDEMMLKAGFDNVIQEDRYPSVTEDDIKRLNPEVVLLSSEPFPFKEKHVQMYRKLLPEAKVKLVNGEMFSWYGSRLLKVIPYLKALQETITNEE